MYFRLASNREQITIIIFVAAFVVAESLESRRTGGLKEGWGACVLWAIFGTATREKKEEVIRSGWPIGVEEDCR
jgi:hypothetical protein